MECDRHDGFKVGDIICTSEPYVHVLMHRERERRCETCLKSDVKLFRCTHCSISRYCNQVCQRKAWKFHKDECKGFQRIFPKIPKDAMLLLYRLLRKSQSIDGANECAQIFGRNRMFKHLMAHVDELKKDVERCQEFYQLYLALKVFADHYFLIPEFEELLEIIGKMAINTFSICDGELQPIGSGLYLGASALNHSCSPNSVVVFDRTKLSVRCIEDIRENEQVTISYVDLLNTTADRRKELQTSYYFTCHCNMCQDISRDQLMRSSLCPAKNCANSVLHNIDGKIQPCSDCGYSAFEECYIEMYNNITEASKTGLESAKKLKADGHATELLNACKACLKIQEDILHPLNVYRVRMLDAAFDACIDTENWQQAADYGQTMLTPYGRYLHRYHPMLGVHLMKLGKIQHLLEFSGAIHSLREAESILSTTHGLDHPLYATLWELLTLATEEFDSSKRGQQPSIKQ